MGSCLWWTPSETFRLIWTRRRPRAGAWLWVHPLVSRRLSQEHGSTAVMFLCLIFSSSSSRSWAVTCRNSSSWSEVSCQTSLQAAWTFELKIPPEQRNGLKSVKGIRRKWKAAPLWAFFCREVWTLKWQEGWGGGCNIKCWGSFFFVFYIYSWIKRLKMFGKSP